MGFKYKFTTSLKYEAFDYFWEFDLASVCDQQNNSFDFSICYTYNETMIQTPVNTRYVRINFILVILITFFISGRPVKCTFSLRTCILYVP